MAFPSRTDYLGLATTGLEIKSSAENKAASTYEARGANGDIAAREVYGAKSSPSCEYTITGDLTLNVKLGCTGGSGTKYALSSVAVKTSLGTAPTLSASGQEVESTATAANSSSIDFGYWTFSRFHDAQIPSYSATASGTATAAFSITDGNLNDCEVTFTGDVSTATVNGDVKAHDIQGGKCVIKGTVVVTGSTAPTLTASGWDITAPLTLTSSDEAYGTYTFELTKSFASAHPSA